MVIMTMKKMIAKFPVSSILKFEKMYQITIMPMAINGLTASGTLTKYPAAVTKMKATKGGSTTWTRKNSHCVAHPAFGFTPLGDQTSTADEYGNIAASSEKANPTGNRTTARIGNMITAPAPVSSNQYGSSASQPPSPAPDARAITLKSDSWRFRPVPDSVTLNLLTCRRQSILLSPNDVKQTTRLT